MSGKPEVNVILFYWEQFVQKSRDMRGLLFPQREVVLPRCHIHTIRNNRSAAVEKCPPNLCIILDRVPFASHEATLGNCLIHLILFTLPPGVVAIGDDDELQPRSCEGTEFVERCQLVPSERNLGSLSSVRAPLGLYCKESVLVFDDDIDAHINTG